MAQPESKLSREILSSLRARGIFAFKVHGGPTMMSGLPDIIACVPVIRSIAVPDGIGLACEDETIGIFVGFETKMPTGHGPSSIQIRVHQHIVDASGRVYVVRSVEDAVAALDDVGWSAPPGNPV